MDRISARNITKRYGPHPVLNGITLEIEKGASYCIWGPNGSGKSTLMKIVAGLLIPTKGEVVYEKNGKKGAPALFRPHIGMAAPDVVLFNELTPAENLSFLARSRGLARDTAYEKELLGKFFPGGVKDEPVGTFSSGMMRKVCFTAAAAHRPGVLLLDEPTSHFDAAGKAAAAEIVQSLKDDIILIVATNDPEERAWCGKTYELLIENAGGS